MISVHQLKNNTFPTCLDAGLEYADRGWRVIPVAHAGKQPLIADWPNMATKDPDIVRGWWDKHPDANVAVVTGSASGLVVIDVDVKSEKGIHGLSTLRQLEAKHGTLPTTVAARTGSGGRHLYYALPEGQQIGNSVGRLGPGLDVRGDGGCVVAPPSVHETTDRYAWLEARSPAEIDLADLPSWVFDLLVAKNATADSAGADGKIPAGQRNDTLFRLAYSLWAKGLAKASVRDAIRRENADRCDPPLPDEEVNQLLDSAVRYSTDGNAADDTRPKIKIQDGELPRMVDEAEQALIADSSIEIYEHAGRLASPISQRRRDTLEGVTRDRGAIILRQLTSTQLVDVLTRRGRWLKWDGRKQRYKVVDCPAKVAGTLLSRYGGWHFPILDGIVEGPTVRADGSIIDQPGYDEQSRLLLDFDVKDYPKIRENPTREDADKALETLKQLLGGFPFVSEADRSVALAAILTAAVRRSLRSTPLFAITAPTMGSGKTLLANVVSLIACGRDAAVMSQARSGEEDRKRLLAILLANDLLVIIDNIERPIGGDTLCAILTQPTYRDRLLGENTAVTVPTNAMFIATGNNLTVQGDMTRRTLLCTIDPGCERPDERHFEVDLRKYILAHRGELVVAALTVLRAYIVAGKPKQEIQPYGSFEEWSDLVRSALVWLDEADPLDTRKKIDDADPDGRSVEAVLLAWWHKYQDRPVTLATVLQETDSANADGEDENELRVALVEAAGDDRGALGTKRLAKWVGRVEGKVKQGLKFERWSKNSSGILRWRVVEVDQPTVGRVTGIAGFESAGKQKNAGGGEANDQPVAPSGANLRPQPKQNPENPETRRQRIAEFKARIRRYYEPGTPENIAYREAVRREAQATVDPDDIYANYP